MKTLIEARPMAQETMPPPQKDVAPRAGQTPGRRERRAHLRHEVDISSVEIHLINVGSKLEGHILDLSLNGCRIHTNNPFPVGIYTRVETSFRFNGLPFRLEGVIQAIHDRHSIGVRFLSLSERKRNQVEELIAEIEETRTGPASEESNDQAEDSRN